jgi:hypothetical protein
MIPVRTNRFMSCILLAGLLTVTAACALVGEMRRAPAVKPAPTVVQLPASELVPVSAPATASCRDGPGAHAGYACSGGRARCARTEGRASRAAAVARNSSFCGGAAVERRG